MVNFHYVIVAFYLDKQGFSRFVFGQNLVRFLHNNGTKELGPRYQDNTNTPLHKQTNPYHHSMEVDAKWRSKSVATMLKWLKCCLNTAYEASYAFKMHLHYTKLESTFHPIKTSSGCIKFHRIKKHYIVTWWRQTRIGKNFMKERSQVQWNEWTSFPSTSPYILSNVNMNFLNKAMYHIKKSRFHKFSQDSNVNMSTMEKFAMLGPKPLKETQFCQLAYEFPIARVPQDVHKLLELKHQQMHHCFKTSCHLYWNYFIFGKQIIVNGPCYLCSTDFFSMDDMNTQHEEHSNYQYLCNRR